MAGRVGKGEGGLRDRIKEGYVMVRKHEDDICRMFLSSASQIAGLTVHGVTDLDQVGDHIPNHSSPTSLTSARPHSPSRCGVSWPPNWPRTWWTGGFLLIFLFFLTFYLLPSS